MTKAVATDTEYFVTKLEAYKKLLEADIAAVTKSSETQTLQHYGKYSRLEVDAFLSILGRGGKRIRGALTMLGYEMSGGTNKAMIIQAARAIEMLHAYILIIDDIQDQSLIRRGGPAAHQWLANYHRRHELAGDSDHFGLAVALNSALSGAHAAQMLLANLDTTPEDRLKVIAIVNRTMLVTAHGQTNDIANEVIAHVEKVDVERVLEWKTAHYTLLNPLHVGMVLAGADCDATDAITDYAMGVGKAFQITDDILGVFGSEVASGKSPMDDLREGKRTFLTMYGLKHAPAADKNFLLSMLGNRHLTPAEFERCQDILVESGALDFARREAAKHVTAGLKSLESEQDRWDKDGVRFLRGLAEYLLERQS